MASRSSLRESLTENEGSSKGKEIKRKEKKNGKKSGPVPVNSRLYLSYAPKWESDSKLQKEMSLNEYLRQVQRERGESDVPMSFDEISKTLEIMKKYGTVIDPLLEERVLDAALKEEINEKTISNNPPAASEATNHELKPEAPASEPEKEVVTENTESKQGEVVPKNSEIEVDDSKLEEREPVSTPSIKEPAHLSSDEIPAPANAYDSYKATVQKVNEMRQKFQSEHKDFTSLPGEIGVKTKPNTVEPTPVEPEPIIPSAPVQELPQEPRPERLSTPDVTNAEPVVGPEPQAASEKLSKAEVDKLEWYKGLIKARKGGNILSVETLRPILDSYWKVAEKQNKLEVTNEVLELVEIAMTSLGVNSSDLQVLAKGYEEEYNREKLKLTKPKKVFLLDKLMGYVKKLLYEKKEEAVVSAPQPGEQVAWEDVVNSHALHSIDEELQDVVVPAFQPPKEEQLDIKREDLDKYENHELIQHVKETVKQDMKEQMFGADTVLNEEQKEELEDFFKAFWRIERKATIPEFLKDGLLG